MAASYEFRGHTLDARERTIFRGPTRIKLRRRSFDLLCVLVANAGRLVERATFFQEVWGGVAVSDEVLRVSVRELRASLGDDAKRPAFIETVARSGYRFIAPVTKRLPSAKSARAAKRSRVAPIDPKRLAQDARASVRPRELLGRDDEMATLLAALRGAVRAIHVHGMGGIGKTALAAAFASACSELRVPFARIDARDVACLPREFLEALSRALGKPRGDPMAALRSRRGRFVVLVDSYEHIAPLDRWIREELLPALPPRALLVLSGRMAPSADWRGEPGWNDTLRALPLGELRHDDARMVLRGRGVPARRDDDALAFTRGHPLALCLVADLIARRPHAPLTSHEAPDVVQALLSRLVKEVTDERQQAALDACSLVRHVTEPVLAAMLGGKDARPLVRWLAGLSFMELGQDGVFPHDLARDVLFADLKWRNPDRLTGFVERASAYLADRLRESRVPAEMRLADELLFLHSHHPVIGAFTRWRGAEGLVVEPARADDIPGLVEIVARHEGRASARIAERWLQAQPDGALIARDGERLPAGLLLTLRLEDASPAEIAADPAARLAMRHVDAQGGARRGQAIQLYRFLMARDTYQAHSPIQSVLGSQCMRMYMTTPRLDWAFTCMFEPERWAPVLKAAFGAELLPPFDHDGRRYGIFSQCFRDFTPAAWLGWLARRGASGEEGSPTKHRLLDRTELKDAVRSALQELHQPQALDDNPLLESPLIAGTRTDRTRSSDPAAALRALLVETGDALKTEPRGEKLYAALRHAYLEPAPSQEAAAKRAGMAFSTYRRNVTQAVDCVVDLLWRRQRSGR